MIANVIYSGKLFLKFTIKTLLTINETPKPYKRRVLSNKTQLFIGKFYYVKIKPFIIHLTI